MLHEALAAQDRADKWVSVARLSAAREAQAIEWAHTVQHNLDHHSAWKDKAAMAAEQEAKKGSG